MRKMQKGFTLIELMIVVAIIGILAAVAIPKFAQMLEKSREGATKGNIGAIKSAISIYAGDWQGAYPTTLQDWFCQDSVAKNMGVAAYIDSIPSVKATAKNDCNKSILADTAKVHSPEGKDLSSGINTGAAAGAPGTTASELNATYAAIGTDGVGWRYESYNGNIWVNNALGDSMRKSYTIFGYE